MRMKLCVVALTAVWLGSLSAAQPGQDTKAAVPTFTKDVAPILYKNCTSCHRPGEIAPMSLLTYEDACRTRRAFATEVSKGTCPVVSPMRRKARSTQAASDRRGEGDALPLGGQRAPKGSEGHARGADLCRGLVDQQPDVILRNAGGLQGPRGRHDRIRVFSTCRPASPSRSSCRRSNPRRATGPSSITCS